MNIQQIKEKMLTSKTINEWNFNRTVIKLQLLKDNLDKTLFNKLMWFIDGSGLIKQCNLPKKRYYNDE